MIFVRFIALFFIFFIGNLVHAQKQVLSYPFQFEKSFLAFADYDAYFLDSRADSTFALVLKDNKKAEYCLLNKNFKVISKVATQIDKTALTSSSLKYAGGTISGNEFHFIYHIKSDFVLETVDFNTKSVSNKTIFELPKSEKYLVSFNDNNRYYTLAANDKTKELVVYCVNERTVLEKKNIPFKVPEEASKSRDKLSEYLADLKVFMSDEYPDMSDAVKSAKLFCSRQSLDIVVNDGDNPTQIFSISVPGLTASEKFVDFRDIISKEEKGKVYVNSFLKNNILFSLALNKRNIRVVAHDIVTGNLMNKHEINEDSDPSLFAEGPFSERRLGRKMDEKEVGSTKKLIKAFTKGTEGLMITENKAGQLIVTAGTYDLIPVRSGGSSGHYVGGMSTGVSGAAAGAPVYNPHKYYNPGSPSYTRTDARFYTTTYFRMLLNPTTLKVTRGKLQTPVSAQIKDYMETVSKKAKATNQFNIGKKQYFGYYNPEMSAYVIEEIFTR